jgi:hypothetical protein
MDDIILRATVRLLAKKKLGSIDDSQWTMVTRLRSHVEDYLQRGDALQKKKISTASLNVPGWIDWNEQDGLI